MSEPKIYKGIASEERLAAEIDRLNRELAEAGTIANNNYEVILKCNRQINDLKRELARYRNGEEGLGMKTTLNKIREHQPCTNGWEKLLVYLGKTKADDEPLSIATIIDSNGLNDALWCLRAVEGHDREIRLYAVWCARQVQHLLTDQRSLDALDVAERYANGEATKEELAVAWDAAWAPEAAARAAQPAAWWAAWAAAWSATTIATADAATWEDARAKQEAELRRICEEE